MPTVPKRLAQTVGPSAPQTRAAPTVFQQVRGASIDAFGGAEAKALGQVGEALGGEADRLTSVASKRLKAEAKIQSSRTALDRLKREGQLSTDLFAFSTKIIQEQEISDPNILRSAGIGLQDIGRKSVDALRATGASIEEILQYEAVVQENINTYRDDLAKKSVSVANGLRDVAVDTEIKKLAAEAGEAPETALTIASEGVPKALVKLEALIPEDGEAAFAVRAQAEVFKSAINTLLLRADAGSLQEVLTFTEHPRVQAVMGSEALRKILSRKSTIGDPPRIWSAQETSDRLRLPLEQAQNVIVEEDKSGFSILFKPERDRANRQAKIDAATEARIKATGEDKLTATAFATGVVDGQKRLVVVEPLGQVLLIDEITQEVKEIRKAQPAAVARVEQQKRMGLWQQVLNNPLPVSGLLGTLIEGYVSTVGQVPGTVPSEFADVVGIRREILLGHTLMETAFSRNIKYPVALRDKIIKETGIDPGVMKSDVTLLINMKRVANFLVGTIEQERAIDADPNRPQKRRVAAGIAVANMENFLEILGVPENADPLAPEDPPIQILTVDQYKALAPGTSYIDPKGIKRIKRGGAE